MAEATGIGVDELRAALKRAFGGAARAVSEVDDWDFWVVPKVSDREGKVVLSIYPNPVKEFVLIDPQLEEASDEEWLIRDSKQRWSLRRIEDETEKKAYIKAMRASGVDE